jgi:FixJ family two-component response regulator
LKKSNAFIICLLDDEELLQSVQKALTRSIDQRRRSTEKTNARHLFDLLTPREFQVMELVVAGMLNKQIAGELGMAEKTVKVHRGRVMQKLSVRSVAELVRLVQKGVPSRSRKT